jgi:hypothetical protein
MLIRERAKITNLPVVRQTCIRDCGNAGTSLCIARACCLGRLPAGAEVARQNSEDQLWKVFQSTKLCQSTLGLHFICSGFWPEFMLTSLLTGIVDLRQSSWRAKVRYWKRCTKWSQWAFVAEWFPPPTAKVFPCIAIAIPLPPPPTCQ